MTGHTGTRIVGVLVALVVGVVTLTACDPAPDTYVAIGDSYTSGPGISNQVDGPSEDPNGDLGSPIGCMRSDRDYPARARGYLADAGISFDRFWDFSCSGAKTTDFHSPQSVDGDDNIAQLAAVGGATRVVTIGIGGNDIGFSDIIKSCVAWQSCKSRYVDGDHDELRERIADLAPEIDRVLADVHTRAPQASVFVVGYPAILPENPGVLGCQTMSQSASTYLSGVHKDLNAMLEDRAAANGATFVDLYTPSVGHDTCASDPWVNGLIAIPPVHPNAKGMDESGKVVAAAIAAELAD